MFRFSDSTQHFIDLLFAMTDKELRARYKHTVFGFLWVVINPLLQMLVIGFVFKFFIKEPIKNYYYYLFVGLLTWNFFSLSLTKATPSIVFERSLIKKARFPHYVIPLSIILSNLVNFLLGLLLLLIPILIGGLFIPNRIPELFFGIILIFLLSCGLSLFTSALNVPFRDINFFVQALLIIWFYATPIVYSIFVVPKDIIWLWRLNPVTAPVQLLQYALADAPPPGPAMIASNTFLTVLITILGLLLFHRISKNFDDWV